MDMNVTYLVFLSEKVKHSLTQKPQTRIYPIEKQLLFD